MELTMWLAVCIINETGPCRQISECLDREGRHTLTETASLLGVKIEETEYEHSFLLFRAAGTS